jgi:hypothetical protein
MGKVEGEWKERKELPGVFAPDDGNLGSGSVAVRSVSL